MNRILIFILCSLFASSSFAQINFNKGKVKEVMLKAQQTEKLIFVDVYATWCGPCKWLDANHFQDESAGNFFNSSFIPFKIDAEKGEGIDFAKKYNVDAYPSLLFINGEGELVHKFVGAPKGVEALIDVGKAALDPEKQLFTLHKRYEMGEEDGDFLRNYANALMFAYEDANEVAGKYFQAVSIEALADTQEWQLFTNTITDFNSPTFRQFFNRKDEYKEMYGKEVDLYVESVIDETIYKVAEENDESGFHELIKSLNEMEGEGTDKLIAYANYQFYMDNEDLGHKSAKDYFDNYEVSWDELNEVAWNYYKKVDDPEPLNDALAWIKKSISQEKNYYNTDTEAHLLYKLQMWKEAEKSAKVAIKTGQESGDDVSSTQDLLKKIMKQE